MMRAKDLRGRRGVLLLGAAVLLGACGDSSSGPPDDANAVLVSATLSLHGTQAGASQFAAIAGAGEAFQPVTDADMYSVRYRTQGLDGSTTVASGAVWLPTKNGNWPVLVYLHGTALPKDEVPSEGSQEGYAAGLLFGTAGYIVVLPDYLGMGSGSGMHPWQHAASEASAGADLLRAAGELAAKQQVSENGKLFITGYSQGGHAAMALHRYLETSLSSQFTVTASAPMAGAYDLSGTARGMLQDNPAYLPSVFYTVYLLAVYNQIYHFAPSLPAIFRAPYDAVAADLLTGRYSMGTIMTRLPATPQAVVQPAFLDALLASTEHPFWQALRENDVYDWRPASPMRLFHGSADRDVPIANALTASTRMQQLGADVRVVDVGPLDHAGAVLPAVIAASQWFAQFR